MRLDSALFSNPIWAAPMAGVSNKAFRALCREHGASLAFTEMVSAKALEYDNARTFRMLEPAPGEDRVAVQLFGHEPGVMARQAAAVAERLGERLALIDVNMGCPVPKVHKKGEGAALMRTPGLAAQIVGEMAQALEPFCIPVTAKMRSGWDSSSVNAVELAQMLEASGAAAVGVHGRTAKQLYRGKADWSVIAQVASAVGIPVIGSGDVMSQTDARAMMEHCGVSAVFAARGARGNPWIFSGHEPAPLERILAARRHLQLYCELIGPEHLSPLRSQLAFYVRSLPGAAEVRRSLGRAKTASEFAAVLDDAASRVPADAATGAALPESGSSSAARRASDTDGASHAAL